MFDNDANYSPNENHRGLALTAFQKILSCLLGSKPPQVEKPEDDDQNLLPEFPDIWIC